MVFLLSREWPFPSSVWGTTDGPESLGRIVARVQRRDADPRSGLFIKLQRQRKRRQAPVFFALCSRIPPSDLRLQYQASGGCVFQGVSVPLGPRCWQEHGGAVGPTSMEKKDTNDKLRHEKKLSE